MPDRKVTLVAVLALFVAAIVIAVDEWSATLAPPEAPPMAEGAVAASVPAVAHEREAVSTLGAASVTPEPLVGMAETGSVTATFLADPLIELFEVKLVPPAVPSDSNAAFQLLSRLRGKPQQLGDRVCFRWTGLAPGWYRFVVASSIRTLMQFDISVGVGEVRDARLLDIDMRNRLRALRVQVTDLAGERLPVPALLYVHGSNDPADWTGQQIVPAGSPVATFAVGQAVDLFVVATGWRGRRLSGVAGDVTVALKPAPKFTLRCTQLAALPGTTGRLSWMLATPLEPLAAGTVGDGWRRVGPVERALIGEGLPHALVGGTASGSVASAQPLAVQMEVVRQTRSVRVAVQPAVIDGDLLVDGQTIELTLDLAQLREALDGVTPR